MLKSTIKEIFIILLLCIAILLILAILFYDYIPISTTVPTKEEYVTPEEVKAEIEESITESDKIEVTYEITESDLEMYKQTGTYTEGKANPFALTESSNNTDNTNNTNDTNDTDDTDNSNKDQNEQENVTNTFWNDEGIK